MKIRIWADNLPVGAADRLGKYGTTFVYDPALNQHSDISRALSVTMPVRTDSFDISHGLTPIFDMNQPEGRLREELQRSLAKAAGELDALTLLSVVGRGLVGRLRFSAEDADLEDEIPFQSIDEILTSKRDDDLFEYLLPRFSRFSLVSGVQPKVLVRDTGHTKDRLSQSFVGATHIVKFWEKDEYPELAANEFFCLKVAERAGLKVPRFHLSENGSALVVERFDLRENGTYQGFEDFCVLNGYTSERKYKGGYETQLFGRFKSFAAQDEESASAYQEDVSALFRLFLINCALRNGDAHLKNFGITYDDVSRGIRLAPAYDIVTTTVYLPKDAMALTLNGTTRWPNAKALMELGTVRCNLSPRIVEEMMEHTSDVISEVAAEMRSYAANRPEFSEVAHGMLRQWEDGVKTSFSRDRTLVSAPANSFKI